MSGLRLRARNSTYGPSMDLIRGYRLQVSITSRTSTGRLDGFVAIDGLSSLACDGTAYDFEMVSLSDRDCRRLLTQIFRGLDFARPALGAAA